MWLLRGWTYLSIATGSWAVSIHIRQRSAFVPVLSGPAKSSGDVVSRWGDFNEEARRLSRRPRSPFCAIPCQAQRSPLLRMNAERAYQKNGSRIGQESDEGTVDPEAETNFGVAIVGRTTMLTPPALLGGGGGSSDSSRNSRGNSRSSSDSSKAVQASAKARSSRRSDVARALSASATPGGVPFNGQPNTPAESEEEAAAASPPWSWLNSPWRGKQQAGSTGEGTSTASASSITTATTGNSEKNESVSPVEPPISPVKDSALTPPYRETPALEGDEEAVKRVINMVFSLAKAGWSWSEKGRVENQEVELEKNTTRNAASPAKGSTTTSRWPPRRGGGAKDGDGDDTALGGVQVGYRRDGASIPAREEQLAEGEKEGIVSGSPPYSPGNPPVRGDTAAAGVDSSASGAGAKSGRSTLSRVKSAARKPLSLLGKPFRPAAAFAGTGADFLLNRVAANSVTLSPPRGYRALQQVSKTNPSFPIRSPWRPSVYRWGASLLSKGSASRGASVENDSAAAGKAWTASGPFASVAAGEPTTATGAQENDGGMAGVTEGSGPRSMRVRNKLSGAASSLVSRLRVINERARILSGGGEEDAVEETTSLYNRGSVGKWAGVKLAGATEEATADPGGGRDDTPWWAAVVVGVGVALYRPVASRRSGLSAGPPAGDEGVLQLEHLLPGEREGEEEEEEPMRSAVAKGAADTVKEQLRTIAEVVPARRLSTRPRPGRVVLRLASALFGTVATTSRRGQLWIMLRRKSMARAEPLLSGVDTGISTLSVPLAPSVDPSSSTEELSGTAQLENDEASTSAAHVEGKTGAPQAVGGGGWNLFGFFPKDKEQEQARVAIAGSSATGGDTDPASTAVTTASSASESSSDGSKGEDAGEGQPAALWPRSAWIQGLDPRAQVSWSPRTFRALTQQSVCLTLFCNMSWDGRSTCVAGYGRELSRKLQGAQLPFVDPRSECERVSP